MKIIKNGGHRLFEKDPETARIVSEMLLHPEKTAWTPFINTAPIRCLESRELRVKSGEIESIIGKLPKQLIDDTDFCQGNVRRFAQARLKTSFRLKRRFDRALSLVINTFP